MDAARFEVRRQITKAGHYFKEQMDDLNHDLGDIAGEFMSVNEEYVLNHVGHHATRKTPDILRTGFTENQKLFLENLSEDI